MAKLSDLGPTKGATHRPRRLGRGVSAGQGKSVGKGNKGQHTRRNGTKAPYFEGGQLPLIRRLPFKRGFNNIFKIYYQSVNLEVIADKFKSGEDVTIEEMVARRVLRDPEQPIVILSDGDMPGPLTIHAHRFSKQAREKIEAAGGQAIEIKLLYTGARATVKKLRKEQIAKLRAELEAEAANPTPGKRIQKRKKYKKMVPFSERPVVATPVVEAPVPEKPAKSKPPKPAKA